MEIKCAGVCRRGHSHDLAKVPLCSTNDRLDAKNSDGTTPWSRTQTRQAYFYDKYLSTWIDGWAKIRRIKFRRTRNAVKVGKAADPVAILALLPRLLQALAIGKATRKEKTTITSNPLGFHDDVFIPQTINAR